ncbi:MAG: hypothetical protein R2710_01665 [Acidimicrobiales bacterium]
MRGPSQGPGLAAQSRLADLGAPTAELIDGNLTIPSAEPDGRYRCRRSGGRIATDGTVVEGDRQIDTSMLTGEPVPVTATVGDSVAGATVNTSGYLVVEANFRRRRHDPRGRSAGSSLRAQGSPGPHPATADRAAGVFVPVILVIALGTVHRLDGDQHSAAASIVPTVAVLVIACPCALGLATIDGDHGRHRPRCSARRADHGGEVLEAANDIDTVVLDKTGTVTEGR